MARGGGEMRERETVPVTGASGFVRSSTTRSAPTPTKETARSVAVAGFAFVHAAVILIVFLVREKQYADHLCQCMEACPVLTNMELFITLFYYYGTSGLMMTLSSVVQMLAAALALVSTERPCRRGVASIVALCITSITGMLSIRLIYTALFGSNCCFSGGIFQVASAVAVALGQAAIPVLGSWFSSELVHAFCHDL